MDVDRNNFSKWTREDLEAEIVWYHESALEDAEMIAELKTQLSNVRFALALTEATS